MNFYTCFQPVRKMADFLKGFSLWRYRHYKEPMPFKRNAMRINIVAFIVTVSFFNLPASVHAQRITLKVKDTPLETVFARIKKQSGYFFWYEKQHLLNTKRVTLDLKNVDLKEALDACFQGQPLEYTINEKMIVVKPKPQKSPTADFPRQQDISGKVIGEDGSPLPGASVKIKETGLVTGTDNRGNFSIVNAPEKAILTVSFIGYETIEFPIEGRDPVSIRLKESSAKLDAVNVVSTGYQQLPKERITGSFSKVDNELFNRSVSTNVTDRLEGIVNGLTFARTDYKAPTISIRGRSTIFANADPLIVVDNFPYDGDINNINPNDVENITVLKDAAAASIWGVRAGNGVIVITTKRGKNNQATKIQFNSSVTIGGKPDLHYLPYIGASDFIDVETWLYGKGYYNSSINNTTNWPALSPVVELLVKKSAGTVAATEADAQINSWRNIDFRDDISRYFYRNSNNMQHAISLSGGGSNSTYYVSAGYDKNLDNLVRNTYERLSLNAQNTYSPVRNVDLSVGVTYTQSNRQINNDGYSSLNNGQSTRLLYPYTRLADDNENPLAVTKSYRVPFVTAPAQSVLLDWQYRPLEELKLADNNSGLSDFKVNTGLSYRPVKSLSIDVKYQYEGAKTNNEELHSEKSFYTRDLINTYSSITNGTVTRNIPLGAILDKGFLQLASNTIRAQANYNGSLGPKHSISAIAGAETREVKVKGLDNRLYGYDPATLVSKPVNYNVNYIQYPSGSGTIEYRDKLTDKTDRFGSYFANAAYTYNARYTISASGRIDQSNYFGVNANQRAVPLWSLGASWNISSEQFYTWGQLPALKLRATYGYNGNLDKTITAYTTARLANLQSFTTSTIINPQNPDLQWERIGVANIGFDFASRNNVVSGSIEYYHKTGKDLIGLEPVAPSSGVTTFKGNVAGISGNGIDLQLSTKNSNKGLIWTTDVLLSRSTNKVTDYGVVPTSGTLTQSGAGSNTSVVVMKGKPIYSIYSYKWAGLDPANGDPQGILNGKVSKDYNAITGSSSKPEDLVFNGSAQPTWYGSLRNTFRYRQFSVSANILFKAGYYFRRPSLDQTSLYATGIGNSDYSLRWQKPGDELITNVPSLAYPNNSTRALFYRYSEALVEKGDHVRIQDIQLNYTFNERTLSRGPFKQLQVYVYANNLGILWRANKYHIDPDYVPSGTTQFLPPPKSIAFGVKAAF